ncbi:MAG: hypothetical protein IPM13_00130 [Phycisphaerales bacterium]|nr:hypothetical protein [Phycisphaerales bacterium]
MVEGIPWDDLGETQVEPIFTAWQKMPDDKRRLIQLVLQDINELADERGVKVLVEEIQRIAPDRLAEFDAIVGQADRAMWTYLNVKMAFVVAAYFARAEALSTGRYWITRNSLPKQSIAVGDSHKVALKAALAEFYWDRQLRGKICEIEHYTRIGGSEYFFAYLDDYPDDPVVFDDTGHLVRSKERRVFDNVFVFNPSDGTLDVYAKGGKKVYEPLQQRFCKAVLGVDIGPADPKRPAYALDHLLKPDRRLPTDPKDRIVAVTITRVRVEPIDRPGEYIELGLNPERGIHRIDQAIAEYLNTQRLTPDRLRVKQMSFELRFSTDARPRPLRFSVSCPNSCDLKSKPDELRAIGERCLRLWEVTHG